MILAADKTAKVEKTPLALFAQMTIIIVEGVGWLLCFSSVSGFLR